MPKTTDQLEKELAEYKQELEDEQKRSAASAEELRKLKKDADDKQKKVDDKKKALEEKEAELKKALGLP
jgi:hypothetical protein